MTGRKSGRHGLIFTAGAITASIAHELRQPLAAIAVNASAGLRWLEPDRPQIERARRSMMRVLRDTDRAAEIITRIKALATRGAVTERRRLSINAIVRRVVRSAGHGARAAHADLCLQLAADIPPILGDVVQLQQLVYNLVANAVDAMTGTGGKLKRVDVLTRRGADDTVVVTVRDAGKAIDAPTLARAFDPFYTTKPDGMGLGLPICRAIVEAHGGRLWATPNRRGGAAFHFSLPGASAPRRRRRRRSA